MTSTRSTSTTPADKQSEGAQTTAGRIPALVNAGVLVGVILIIAAQLVSAPRTSLPTIAEIAPQAIQQITDPPPEQATDLDDDPEEEDDPEDDSTEATPDGAGDSENTNGDGTDGGSDGDDPDEPENDQTPEGDSDDDGPETDPPIETSDDPGDDDDGDEGDPLGDSGPTQPAQFSCTGSPPRQTEDPQSPKCVPFWDGGNNFGSTSPGVTADEVRIVVPGADTLTLPAMESYFNQRYNFYGRRLKLISTSDEREEALADPVNAQLRAATNARTTHDAFASSDFWYAGGVIYMRALARQSGQGHPVIGVSYQSIIAEKDLAAEHPYLWQYPMATDVQLAHLGEWTCKRLAGFQATLSNDPLMSGQTRKLGLILVNDFAPAEYGVNGRTDTSPLEQEIAGCGGVAARAVVDLAVDNDQQNTNAVAQMRSAGVTSILCVCDSDPMRDLWGAATATGYLPEWIVPSHTENEHVWIKRQGNEVQSSATMGLEFHPTFLTVQQDPWFWAAVEGSPGVFWDQAGNESSYSRQAFYHPLYRSLLIIAAGIQLAGPNLTPERFAAGLQQADAFPNPNAGLAAGAVGFVGDHSMTDDAGEYWYDPSATGPFGPTGFQGAGSGSACFMNGAARYRLGQWPTAPAPIGQAPCFTGETLFYNGQ